MEFAELPLLGRLAVLVAGAGLLLVVAFNVAQGINDAPPSQGGSAGDFESYQDRVRWFSALEEIGQGLLMAAVALGVAALVAVRSASGKR